MGGGKFSLPETVILLMISGFVDLLEVFVALISPIPIIGQLALLGMLFVDATTLFVIQFWLRMKGVRQMTTLIGNLIEFIPYIDILPIRTATLIATIYITNKGIALGPKAKVVPVPKV